MGQNQAYIEKLQAQLEEWDKELDKLKAKVGESSTRKDASSLQEHIKVLSKKRDETKEKLDELYQATAEDALDDIKQGAKNAFDSLKKAFEKGWSEF